MAWCLRELPGSDLLFKKLQLPVFKGVISLLPLFVQIVPLHNGISPTPFHPYFELIQDILNLIVDLLDVLHPFAHFLLTPLVPLFHLAGIAGVLPLALKWEGMVSVPDTVIAPCSLIQPLLQCLSPGLLVLRLLPSHTGDTSLPLLGGVLLPDDIQPVQTIILVHHRGLDVAGGNPWLSQLVPAL